MKRLPHCDVLFRRFFEPWYSEDDRQRRTFSATRPDMLCLSDLRGRSGADLSPLADTGRTDVLEQVAAMLEAARRDWPSYLPVRPPVSFHWLNEFDEHYNRQRVLDLVSHSLPSDFSNDYVVICCELGAVIAAVFRERLPRLEWVPDWPYWDSALFDPVSANIVPVFHWGIKKLSSYALTDGIVPKLERCIELLAEDTSR